MKRLLSRLRLALYWPFLYIYFHSSKRARVLIRCQGSVLLVEDRWNLWFDDHGYTVPGGGIAKGELPVTAAARELNEELGLTVATADLHAIGEGKVSQHGIRYYAYFFIVDLAERPAIRLQQKELASADWIKQDDLTAIDLKLEAVLALEFAAKS